MDKGAAQAIRFSLWKAFLLQKKRIQKTGRISVFILFVARARMGIKNFWSIVEPHGRNISIESLRGKRLAVDISIWLNQIVRAMRTNEGDTVSNAHIYIVVFRLCKLLYYGIKPVIVFDGDAPALKKRTIAERRERANRAAKSMKEIQKELVATELVEQLKDVDCCCWQ